MGGSFLHDGTVFGCLRGLETFSQLVRFNFDLEQYQYQIAHSSWSIVCLPVPLRRKGQMCEHHVETRSLPSCKHSFHPACLQDFLASEAQGALRVNPFAGASNALRHEQWIAHWSAVVWTLR
jgi:hypothetical protein